VLVALRPWVGVKLHSAGVHGLLVRPWLSCLWVCGLGGWVVGLLVVDGWVLDLRRGSLWDDPLVVLLWGFVCFATGFGGFATGLHGFPTGSSWFSYGSSWLPPGPRLSQGGPVWKGEG